MGQKYLFPVTCTRLSSMRGSIDSAIVITFIVSMRCAACGDGALTLETQSLWPNRKTRYFLPLRGSLEEILALCCHANTPLMPDPCLSINDNERGAFSSRPYICNSCKIKSISSASPLSIFTRACAGAPSCVDAPQNPHTSSWSTATNPYSFSLTDSTGAVVSAAPQFRNSDARTACTHHHPRRYYL